MYTRITLLPVICLRGSVWWNVLCKLEIRTLGKVLSVRHGICIYVCVINETNMMKYCVHDGCTFPIYLYILVLNLKITTPVTKIRNVTMCAPTFHLYLRIALNAYGLIPGSLCYITSREYYHGTVYVFWYAKVLFNCVSVVLLRVGLHGKVFKFTRVTFCNP